MKRFSYLLALLLVLVTASCSRVDLFKKNSPEPQKPLDIFIDVIEPYTGANPTAQCDIVSTNVIYVKNDATGSNTGSDWTNAFTDLQDAIQSATNGSEIWLAAGTYIPSSYHDLDPGSPENPRLKHFRLKKGVAIYGGFNGTESCREERDSVNNLTVISGDIGIVGDSTDNVYHVFYNPETLALDHSTIIDGVVIKDGNANGTGMHKNGAGLYNKLSAPKIINVTFENNIALSSGAAIYNDGVQNLLIQNSEFKNNECTGFGTGIVMYNIAVKGSILNSKFYNNIGATNNAVGGAIYNKQSEIEIKGSEFNKNGYDNSINGIYAGGAIADIMGKLEIVDTLFIENRAGAAGGAIYTSATDLNISNSTFDMNKVSIDGGAIYAQGSNNIVTIKGTKFLGNRNSASYNGGGAIKIYGLKELNISSSIFAKNYSNGSGGAIYAINTQDLKLSYLTFYGNKKLGANNTGKGGAIMLQNSNMELSNSIMWDNQAGIGANIYVQSSTSSIKDSCIKGSFVSGLWDTMLGDDLGGNIDADPMFIDTFNDNYELNASSTCINMGAFPL